MLPRDRIGSTLVKGVRGGMSTVHPARVSVLTPFDTFVFKPVTNQVHVLCNNGDLVLDPGRKNSRAWLKKRKALVRVFMDLAQVCSRHVGPAVIRRAVPDSFIRFSTKKMSHICDVRP